MYIWPKTIPINNYRDTISNGFSDQWDVFGPMSRRTNDTFFGPMIFGPMTLFRTNGSSDQWVFGPMGRRTNGFSDQWVVGPMGCRTIETSPLILFQNNYHRTLEARFDFPQLNYTTILFATLYTPWSFPRWIWSAYTFVSSWLTVDQLICIAFYA